MHYDVYLHHKHNDTNKVVVTVDAYNRRQAGEKAKDLFMLPHVWEVDYVVVVGAADDSEG